MGNTRRPDDHRRQNDQVRDAAGEVGLTREQRFELRRRIEHESRELGENLSYGDLVDIAREVKLGR